MVKIEILVNLENFMNMTITATNSSKDRFEQYREILVVLNDWVEYSKFARSLAEHMRWIIDSKTFSDTPLPEKTFEPEPSFEIKTEKRGSPDPEEKIWFANLYNITPLEIRGLAYRIIKEGDGEVYETFIAISHIAEEILPLKLGIKMAELQLKPASTWILKKDNKGIPKTEWRVYDP